MTIPMGNNPQVGVAPRCDGCGSFNTIAVRSQGFETEYEGERCRAQKQYRQCRSCGHNFPYVKIKGAVAAQPRGWGQKPKPK